MKNIIKIDIDGDYVVTHNGDPFNNEEVICNLGKNILQIKGDNLNIKSITMFNLGKEELVKLCIQQGNTYILEYEYPVFSWLHQKLNHGWLIKKDLQT